MRSASRECRRAPFWHRELCRGVAADCIDWEFGVQPILGSKLIRISLKINSKSFSARLYLAQAYAELGIVMLCIRLESSSFSSFPGCSSLPTPNLTGFQPDSTNLARPQLSISSSPVLSQLVHSSVIARSQLVHKS